MLKSNWYACPTQNPNPRLTIETDDAVRMERQLRESGVIVSDPIEVYDEFYVGSFLDSEGNKLWFLRAGEGRSRGSEQRSAVGRSLRSAVLWVGHLQGPAVPAIVSETGLHEGASLRV